MSGIDYLHGAAAQELVDTISHARDMDDLAAHCYRLIAEKVSEIEAYRSRWLAWGHYAYRLQRTHVNNDLVLRTALNFLPGHPLWSQALRDEWLRRFEKTAYSLSIEQQAPLAQAQLDGAAQGVAKELMSEVAAGAFVPTVWPVTGEISTDHPIRCEFGQLLQGAIEAIEAKPDRQAFASETGMLEHALRDLSSVPDSDLAEGCARIFANLYLFAPDSPTRWCEKDLRHAFVGPVNASTNLCAKYLSQHYMPPLPEDEAKTEPGAENPKTGFWKKLFSF